MCDTDRPISNPVNTNLYRTYDDFWSAKTIFVFALSEGVTAMIVDSNRKCRTYANPTTHFHHRGLANSTTSLPSQILAGYGDWVNDSIQQGWDGYLLSVMFHNLPGPVNSQIIQMHQEVTTLFSKLITRMIRNPRSPTWVPLLPKGLFVPDLPYWLAYREAGRRPRCGECCGPCEPKAERRTPLPLQV